MRRLFEPAWSISAWRSSRTVPNFAPTFSVSQAAVRLLAESRIASTRSSTASSWYRLAVAQRVDPAPVADPVEEDLEDPEPLGLDERLRPQDHAVQSTPHEGADGVLGLDLRLAVVADAVERVVLLDRVLVRHAVDGR